MAFAGYKASFFPSPYTYRYIETQMNIHRQTILMLMNTINKFEQPNTEQADRRCAFSRSFTRMFDRLCAFLDERIRAMLKEAPARSSSPIPRRIRIEHCGSTLLLLARHVALGEERVSREAAHDYLTLLLGPMLA